MSEYFFSDPIESKIVEEIRHWSSDVLEKPNAYFNNLPACPYARNAWLSKKVAVLFVYDEGYQSLYSSISQFDDNYDIALVVDMGSNKTPEDFHNYLDDLNEVISNGMFIDKDIWLMGFHHEDEASDFVGEVSFEADDKPYSIIFVQRLSKLQQAADKLNKKGYYDTYDAEHNAREIYEVRETLYRKLQNGYETKESQFFSKETC